MKIFSSSLDIYLFQFSLREQFGQNELPERHQKHEHDRKSERNHRVRFECKQNEYGKQLNYCEQVALEWIYLVKKIKFFFNYQQKNEIEIERDKIRIYLLL